MISSDIIRGAVDLLILGCLAEAPSYGYQISRDIAHKSGGSYQIKETTLYSAFRRLEKAGDIVSYPGTESGGRPRTYYRLAPQGQEGYQAKLAEWHRINRLVVACAPTDTTRQAAERKER